MIDIEHDTLVSFKEVASRLPPSDKGNRCRVEVVRRWAKRGSGGVRLAAVLVSGRWYTTWNAVRAFMNPASDQVDPGENLAAFERAERELDRIGI